jgi:ABC-type transport system substrate-binding protein
MLYDRDLAMRTFRNVDGFAKSGIDIAYKMHTIVSAADSTYWMDPTGNDIGPAAQYLHYNAPEATKLLDAAGVKNLKLPFSVQSSASPEHQAVIGMLNATGHFNFVANIVDPGTYVRTIFQPKGVIDGVAPVNGGASQDPDLGLTRHYATSNYTMFTGPLPFDDLLRKQQRELDVNKRKAIWKEIHAKWAENLMDITGVPAGLSDVLETAQPWFANRGALLSPLGNTTYDISLTKNYWYDETKKT